MARTANDAIVQRSIRRSSGRSATEVAPFATRADIGETRRQEVRRLILQGKVPMPRSVRRTGVSSGTVSNIRKAVKLEQGYVPRLK